MSRNKHPRINQYKIDNENFLLEKSKEEGITALESGVLIQKLEEGRASLRSLRCVISLWAGRLL